MPFSWVGAAAGIAGAGQSLGLWGNQGGGGGGGGGGAQFGPGISYGGNYIPTVDADWNKLEAQGQGASTQAYDTANALNLQSLMAGQDINYKPFQNAANLAGQQTGQLANTYAGYGQQMAGQAQNAIGQQNELQHAGQQVFNLGLDPRGDIYKSELQKAQDQAAATNSMYGLGSSGAGAGIQNDAIESFQSNWQNQQLSRALAGLQGMSGANQTAQGYGTQAGADLTAAGTFQGQVPGLTQAAAQIPLNAQQYVAGQPQALANQYLSTNAAAQSPLNAQMSQELAYLTGGTSSAAGVAGLQQQQQAFDAQQQQQGFGGLVQGLGQLSSLWGGLGSGSSGGGSGGYSSSYQPFQNTSSNNYGWSYQDF